jgi:enoyl-CoA hydratase
MGSDAPHRSESATPVRYDVDRGVATITLDSPHTRNALSGPLVTAVRERLADAAADDDVRAVVLTHTGNTFCSGADLSEVLGDETGGALVAGVERLVGLLTSIVELPKPVVARVGGHVRAGGVGLVGACDLAFADTRATFAFTEARLGLAPAVISLTTLPRMSERAASRYFLTGEVFDAGLAERIGLLTQACDDLATTVDDVLEALRGVSPQGARESKALTTRRVRRDLAEGSAAMTELSARLFGSAEAREGVAAFLERRPPRWAVPSEPATEGR